jgi:diguanylate cyclase (GGDEF)-like protein
MNARRRKPQRRRAVKADPKKTVDRRQYDAALAASAPRVVPGDLRTDLSFPALLNALALALAYALAVVVSQPFVVESGNLATWWPASGVLLAALLLTRRRQWPLVLGLAFLAHLAAGPTLGGALGRLAPGFALAACVQAYLVARLLRRFFRTPFALTGLRELIGLAGAAVAASALAGLAQAALLVAVGEALSLLDAWLAWGLAGSLGVLAVTPLILAVAASAREAMPRVSWREAVEPALALLALAVAAAAIFSAPPAAPGVLSLAYLVFPFLLWAALRLRRPGAAAAAVILSGLAAWFTVQGRGPFAAGELSWLQVYLGVATLSTLALAMVVAQRRRAAGELQQAHARLSAWARELEQRNRQVASLNRLADLFQSCMTAEDAYHVIALSGPQLFPGWSGALYLLNTGRDQARAVAHWGPIHLPEAGFSRDDCLALRRGRPYSVGPGRPTRPCRHVQPADDLPYVCVPLVAVGEVVGVLHLRAVGPQRSQDLDAAMLDLARAAADSMALALGYVRLRHALREQSIRDPLTGLFNRRYMEETLDRELGRARRGGYPVGVIMLDVDDFKRVNDTFGHEAGDAALRDLGQYLRAEIRAGDVACRYGGEEFTLILPNTPFKAMRERAEQLRQGIQDLRLEHQGRALGPLTFSLGLAAFPAHGASRAEVLQAADAALYQAKREGRDRVAVFQSGD